MPLIELGSQSAVKQVAAQVVPSVGGLGAVTPTAGPAGYLEQVQAIMKVAAEILQNPLVQELIKSRHAKYLNGDKVGATDSRPKGDLTGVMATQIKFDTIMKGLKLIQTLYGDITISQLIEKITADEEKFKRIIGDNMI